MKNNPAIIALIAGSALVAYSMWALATGRIISTWLQTAYRPSAIYWITVLALLVMGIANLVVGLGSFFSTSHRR